MSDRAVHFAVGDDPTWISQQDSMRLAQDFVSRKGFPNAECVSAEIAGKDCQFLFENSDHTLRVMVEVDRRTKRAKIVERIDLKSKTSSLLEPLQGGNLYRTPPNGSEEGSKGLEV